MPPEERYPVIAICAICNKEYQRSRQLRSKHYCSQPCRDEGERIEKAANRILATRLAARYSRPGLYPTIPFPGEEFCPVAFLGSRPSGTICSRKTVGPRADGLMVCQRHLTS
jgi:hypothetical protein